MNYSKNDYLNLYNNLYIYKYIDTIHHGTQRRYMPRNYDITTKREEHQDNHWRFIYCVIRRFCHGNIMYILY